MSFKSVQKKIASQGHSMESAGAILANASRHASAAAKRKNPKLNRVKGKMHSGGVIPETGAYEMEEGEKVIPASADAKPNAAMRHEDGIMVRSSTEETRAPLRETVSAAPNHGCACEAQPTVDGGHDSGVGHWEGDCKDIRFVRG